MELVDNFHKHSDRNVAVFCLQLYPKLKRLDFAIGDYGIGIRQSLIQNPKFRHYEQMPHKFAAMKAFEDGVSGRKEGGTGFGTVRENVMELGGQLFLSTGNAWIQLGANIDGFKFGELENELPGVQIEVSIPAEFRA